MFCKEYPWRLVLALLLLLGMGWSDAAAADSHLMRYNSDYWTVVLPVSIQPVPASGGSFAAKQEIDGPYHSIVFQVMQEGSLPYDHPAHNAAQRKDFLRQILPSVVAARRRAAEEERNERVASSSISSLPRGFLPAGEICGGFRWTTTDKGVPGHTGKTFVMEGYTLICLGSREKSDSGEYTEILLSERYCRELGHSPTKDFKKIARKILYSVRYLQK